MVQRSVQEDQLKTDSVTIIRTVTLCWSQVENNKKTSLELARVASKLVEQT